MKNLLSFLFACTIATAINDLRPGAEWVLNYDRYSGLNWLDKNQIKPTLQEVSDRITACNAEETAKALQKQRAKIDVKNPNLTQEQRFQALLILLEI